MTDQLPIKHFSQSEDMVDVVKHMQQYMNTYDKQREYERCSTETFVNDMLYGIAIAMNPKRYQFRQGFDIFVDELQDHLAQMNRVSSKEPEKEPEEDWRSTTNMRWFKTLDGTVHLQQEWFKGIHTRWFNVKTVVEEKTSDDKSAGDLFGRPKDHLQRELE